MYELSSQEKVTGILERCLKEIYGDKIQKLEVVGTMPYPLKEHLFIVRYNIDLENEVPIRRAQIVVDIVEEELKKFEPGLM